MLQQVESSQNFGFRSILVTISSLSPYDSVISLLSIIIGFYSAYQSLKKRALISQYLLPYSILTAFAQITVLYSKFADVRRSSIREAIFGYTTSACAAWLLVITIDMFLIFKSEKFNSKELHTHRSCMFRIYYFHSFLLLPIILPIITSKPLSLEKFNTVAFVFYLVIRALGIGLYSAFVVFIMSSSGRRDRALPVRNIVFFLTATMYVWSVPVLTRYSRKILSNCWLSDDACTPKVCVFVLRSCKLKIFCSFFWIENIFIILGMRVLDKYCERKYGASNKISQVNLS